MTKVCFLPQHLDFTNYGDQVIFIHKVESWNLISTKILLEYCIEISMNVHHHSFVIDLKKSSFKNIDWYYGFCDQNKLKMSLRVQLELGTS